MDQYQSYIHKSRYARWIDTENRRETWEETVGRYCDYFAERCPQIEKPIMNEIADMIKRREIMPSMRALMTAGKALDRDNVAGYNCSFLAVDHPRAFDELMYILMCGTGGGFTVELSCVTKLPTIESKFDKVDYTIKVRDSKIGWADAFRELVAHLYDGMIPAWDTSAVRQSGARLKTFGGRASGPEPLVRLFEFTVELFKRAAGRKLTTVECHDLCCMIADIVVVGGVRRSALISLSDLDDTAMRSAKSGAWWEKEPQRMLANNSAVYTHKPDIGVFMSEWQSLYNSKSGERGIVNRAAAIAQAQATGRRKWEGILFGTNPCGEIWLRPNSFCNLTEVVVRATDTRESLARKVALATIMGTMQSTLTDFRYLRPIWKKNAEEERLLGVSLTGIMDNSVMNGSKGDARIIAELVVLKQVAIETNKEYAELLGINQSAAITCVKPSGTVSQLVGSASGIHPRYSDYYIRRVRGDKKDPLSQMLYMQGVPCEDDVTKADTTWVFSFPIKSPEGAITRHQRSAIEQLQLYLAYKLAWCEHNPSITVYVKEDEWLEVGAWVYRNFEHIGGVSFLPSDEGKHTYRQAPYEEIDAAAYEKLLSEMPKINWDDLKKFELEDRTTSSHELACVGGACEIN